MKTKYFNLSWLGLFAMVLLTLFATYSNAQVNYSYDNNGNRVTDNTVMHAMQKSKNKNTNNTMPVYPNPTTGQVSVSIPALDSCGHATVYLIDGSSKVLSTSEVNRNPTLVNISNCPEGVYYIKVITCNQQYTNKIVKVSQGKNQTNTTQPVVPK